MSTLFGYCAVVMSYVSPERVFPFIVDSYGTVAVFVYIWGHLLAAEAADMIASLNAASPLSAAPDARAQFLWGLDHMLSSIRREFDGRAPGA